MKLRVKLVGQPTVTHKVEVEDSATVDNLATTVLQCVTQLHGIAQADVRLSLNKKTVISEDRTAKLSTLGICNSDLLWVLNEATSPAPVPAPPAPVSSSFASAAAAVPPASAASAMQQSIPQELAAKRQKAERPCATCHDAPKAPAPQATVQAEEASSNTMAEDGPAEDHAHVNSVMEAALSDVPSSIQAPRHLVRTLAAWTQTQAWGPTTTAPSTLPATSSALPCPAQPTAQQLLLLAAHAALTERGFQLTAPGNTQPTAMEVDGQPPPDPVQSLLQLPSTGVLSVRYSYPAPTVVGQLIDGPTSTAPAGDAVGVAVCALKAVVAGPHLVLHMGVLSPANTCGSQTLTLSTTQWISPHSADPAQEATSIGVSSVDVQALTPSLLGRYCNLRALWVLLHDSLTAWVVRAACTAMGLDPPGGLMNLPIDLKMVILRQLKAPDLARVTCACLELRHLAGENSLWEPLFHAEFPHVSPAISASAAQKGYQVAFGLAWKIRKERERALRLMARMPPLRPTPLYDPTNPFMPRPHPGMPSNIIGGDYDRLPVLPGMSGGRGGPLFMGGSHGLQSGPHMGLMGLGFAAPRHGGVQGGMPGLGPGGPPLAPVFGSGGRARNTALGGHPQWG